MKEVDDLLTKAERSFATAELLLGAGDADFAASRAYYGYFYVAQGLLIHRGIRPRSHAGLLRQYGMHFEKTGASWKAGSADGSTAPSPSARSPTTVPRRRPRPLMMSAS